MGKKSAPELREAAISHAHKLAEVSRASIMNSISIDTQAESYTSRSKSK